MKKTMKKALALATTMTMIGFSLSACGGSSSSGSTTAAAGAAQTTSGAAETAAAAESQKTDAAAGDATTFVAAHGSTEESTLGQFFIAIQKYLEENTTDLRMEIYPAAQLGNDSELAESIVEGSIQMTSGAASNYINVVPDLAVFDLPFAFNSYQEMRDVYSDPDLYAAVDKVFQTKGLKLGCLRGEGFRTLFTKGHPVAAPEDIKGLKLRVMDNQYHIKLWGDLGADTTTVAFSELYTALQQGVVEAQENTVTSTLTNFNLYEVTDSATMVKHEVTLHPFMINLNWYNSLTEQQQKGLIDACQYAQKNEADRGAEDKENLKKLESDHNYKVFEFTDDQIEQCRQATNDVREQLKSNTNAELYDAYVSTIEKYQK